MVACLSTWYEPERNVDLIDCGKDQALRNLQTVHMIAQKYKYLSS